MTQERVRAGLTRLRDALFWLGWPPIAPALENESVSLSEALATRWLAGSKNSPTANSFWRNRYRLTGREALCVRLAHHPCTVPYGHQYLPAGRAHSECLGCWQSSEHTPG
jgi:hypothetical protein